jgi:hypothetical protein
MLPAMPCLDCFDCPVYGMIQIENSIRGCVLHRSPPSEHGVQFHDILFILFRDILYTPAPAKRARERTNGCHSEPWMFGNKECSSW